MDVTKQLRTTIDLALKEKDIARRELAEAAGKPKAWASKLLNGDLKALSDQQVESIERLLDLKLATHVYIDEKVSPIAAKVDQAIRVQPALADILGEVIRTARWIRPGSFSRQDLREIGAALSSYILRDPPPTDTEIGAEALRLLQSKQRSEVEEASLAG